MKSPPLTTLSMTVWLALGGVLGARTEYFVAPSGDDAQDGTRPAQAFAGIQRGLDALSPGDTLTLLPGEYVGAVQRQGLGDADHETVIRAAIPGTVLIRGDVPAPAFRKLPGQRFVYVADVDDPVERVIRQDTGAVIGSRPGMAELEFNPGGYYQDLDRGKLYLSNPDLTSAETGDYTLAVTRSRAGLLLRNPVRVTVEGLAVTGFYNAQPFDHREMPGGNATADRSSWGILIANGRDCIIRHCTAFRNTQGIGIRSSEGSGGNAVEHSTAYENGMNIAVIAGNRDVIRDSLAYHGGYGIRHYGGRRPALQARNLAWGNRVLDFQLKGIDYDEGWTHGNIALGHAKTQRARNTLIVGRNRHMEPDASPSDTIRFLREPDLNPDIEFADPLNLDFRLQSTSRFRGAAEDGADQGPCPFEATVFFVAPQGDDANDGLSTASAWQTLAHAAQALRPGDTLYLSAGRYAADVRLQLDASGQARPTAIRARGQDAVTLDGAIRVAGGANLEFERLHFARPVTVEDAADIRFRQCSFQGQPVALVAQAVSGLRLTHNRFDGFTEAALHLRDCASVFIRGNRFDNRASPALVADATVAGLYSDYNAFSRLDAAWASVPETAVGFAPEAYSREINADPDAAAGPASGSRVDLAAVGPLGKPFGNHRDFNRDFEAGEFKAPPAPLSLDGPHLHAVTDTTANLEWWASASRTYRLVWGKVGEPAVEQTIRSHRYGSFSLTGLDPGQAYHLTLSDDTPRVHAVPADAAPDVARRTLTFTTAAEPRQPVDSYVSPQGDDANDGRTPETAWQTINRAAASALAGDTVWIGEGVYSESVWIRATGAEGLPVTFRSRPGEKVVFDGRERTIGAIFTATHKAHLNIDGFYFVNLGSGAATPWADSRSGAIVLYGCRDVNVSRCFLDGRGSGYSHGLLRVRDSAAVTLRNSVMTAAMGGAVGFSGTPGMRIENNVFLRNLISAISEVINNNDQPFYIRNNLFTDSLPSKAGTSLHNIGNPTPMRHDNNGYYLRLPEDEKTAIAIYHYEGYRRAAEVYGVSIESEETHGIPEILRLTLSAYRERFAPEDSSFVGNPRFAGAARLDLSGNQWWTEFTFDALSRDDDLDFPDLFATCPDMIERGIGLQPEAFADFHFNP